MSQLRVAIAGATGYAGEELIRILLGHPFVSITGLAASAKWDRPVPVAQVFPRFAGRLTVPIESLDPQRLASSADAVFLALPHGVSQEIVPALLDSGLKVIDLGGDFRLKDAEAFQRWYGKPHTRAELLPKAVYGLTELAREAVSKARFVANPGCYATSVILACAPALKAGIADPSWIVADAKSGLTGAGRKAEAHLIFSEINENLWAYKVNRHQHAPEILQALSAFGGKPMLSFVPHVVPLSRGIESTVYIRLAKPVTSQEVAALYREFYRDAPFVRIREEGQWPQIRDVQGTNYCDIGLSADSEQRVLILSSVIDNLTKGAAGQAIQNLNVMCGWPETTGLLA